MGSLGASFRHGTLVLEDLIHVLHMQVCYARVGLRNFGISSQTFELLFALSRSQGFLVRSEHGPPLFQSLAKYWEVI